MLKVIREGAIERPWFYRTLMGLIAVVFVLTMGWWGFEENKEDVIVSVGDDPLIVAGDHGRGRSVAFTSDCGPHWCPPPFVDWEGYTTMWQQLVAWVAGG